MSYLVTVAFVPGQHAAMAPLMPAEQAHVKALREQGVIQALHVAADRSRVWLVMCGESADQVRQTLSAFPLYPYMECELTPLLALEAAPQR